MAGIIGATGLQWEAAPPAAETLDHVPGGRPRDQGPIG